MAATQENSFALLVDEESDDVSAIIARVSAGVDPSSPEKKNGQQQPQSHVAGPNFHSKTAPFSQYARSGRGRGRGRGRGGPSRVSRSSSGNDVKQFGNGQPNGYQRNYGGGNSNQRSFRGTDGYQRNNGGGNGYMRNNGGANGFHQNYKAEGNQELENRGEKGGFDGGWERATDDRNYTENRQLRNGNLSNGEGSRGYRTREGQNSKGHEGMNDGSSEEMNNNGTKNELGANRGHGVNGGAEKKQYVESEQEKLNRLAREEYLEKKAREEEEERKKMTLEQYEKLLVEKRKALEATKTSERKVNIDKDFESMHLVEKKKEDSLFIKLKSEKDKLERKESIGEDEKVHKVKARQIPIDKVFRIRRTPRGQWREDRGRGDAANTGRGRGERGTNGPESDAGRGHLEQAGYKNPNNTGRGRGERGTSGPESNADRGPTGQAGYRNDMGTGHGGEKPSGQGRGHGEQVGFRGGYLRRRVAVPAIGDSRQFPVLGSKSKD